MENNLTLDSLTAAWDNFALLNKTQSPAVFNVIINNELCTSGQMVQFRFRKTKKRRHKRRIAKRPENRRYVSNPDKIFRVGNNIICSSVDYHRILALTKPLSELSPSMQMTMMGISF